ncbi:MAG: hypothetical protein SNJ62_04900 [Chloracidobacterium sp.]
MSQTYLSPAVRGPVAGFGIGGQVQVAHGSVAVPSTVATGQTIGFFDLPAGAKVLNAVLSTPGVGGTAPLSLGDAATSNRFVNAAAAGAAVVANSVAGGIAHTYAERTRIIGTFGTVSGSPTGGTVSATIYYTLDR